MTARFMKGTPYATSEIEMQRPPGFRPRKSGMIISRCVCGTQECDCSLCAHKERNGTDQTAKRCACPCERILAGCTPLSKRMGDLTAEAAGKPFAARVARLSEEFSPLFFLAGHQERFDRFLDGNNDPADTDVLYAVLYLLSADRFLWGKSVPAVKPGVVHFKEIQIHGVDLGGYVLFHTAKDLYQGTQHISLSELTDLELVGDEIFRLIIHAFPFEELSHRFGPPELSNYEAVYDGAADTNDLEALYLKFQDQKPPGFTGYPMSISDVIELINFTKTEKNILAAIRENPTRRVTGASCRILHDIMERSISGDYQVYP